jgi:hypothetical protein
MPPLRFEASVLVNASCDQLRIGEATANRRAEQAGEPVERVAAHVAVIQPERELANVAVQMLGADVVNVPTMPRLRTAKTLSTPFVVTLSRTYSPRPWLMLRWR